MNKFSKLWRVIHYYFYPSESEKKAIYLLIFMILVGDLYMRYFSVKRNKNKIERIEKIDINKADFEDFVNTPLIGPRLAAKIIDYRERKGKIETPEELLEIKGIGEKKLEILKKYFKFPSDSGRKLSKIRQ